MTLFPRTGQSTLEAGQSGAEVTVNGALLALDTLFSLAVNSQESTPPGSPSEGDRHLVIATGSGDFTGQEGKIALFWGGAWQFYTAITGWRLKDVETGQEFYYDGTEWTPLPGLVIPFVTALIAWNNHPAAVGEWRAGTSQRWVGDLRGRVRVRIARLCMGLNSTIAGAKLAVQYSDDAGSNWYYCDSDGANTGPNILIDGSTYAEGTPFDGSWVNLDDAAKIAGVWLRVVGLGGDGAADPQIGRMDIEIQ